MGSAKLSDHIAYPPRLLRAERAAAYLGMSTRTFHELVSAGELPQPKRIRGMVAWDRLELDAYVDRVNDDDGNTFAKILGGAKK